MEDRLDPCPDCSTPVSEADNYCRQCGMYLVALRPQTAIARAEPRAMVTARPGVPAPVRRAATAVAVGTALQLAVGIAGRYLANQATRQAAEAVSGKPRRRGKDVPARREAAPVPAPIPVSETTTVSETLVVRRVWIRRT